MIKILSGLLYCLMCMSLPVIGLIVGAYTNNMFLSMLIGFAGIIGLALWLSIDY